MSNPRRVSLVVLALTAFAAPLRAQEPPPAQTAVARALEAMRLHYDGLATDDPPILVLDADLTGSLDLGRPDYAALGRQITRGGFKPSAATLARAFNSPRRPGPYSLDLRFTHDVVAPKALLMSEPGRGQFCVTVTADADHDIWPALRGLTQDQKVRFFNRHEFWHCAGNRMGERGNADGDHAYLAEILAEETRADINAAADMVALDVEGTQVVRAIAAFRARPGIRNRSHFSTPALLALADRIDAMGLAAFRSLGHDARRDLAMQLAEDHRIAAETLEEMERQSGLAPRTGAPPPSPDHRAEAARLLALGAALGGDRLQEDPDGMIRLTPAQAQAALDWDAPARLQTSAAAQRVGTPAQRLAAARARLIDDLRAEMAREPANPAHGASMVLLDKAYQEALQGLRQPAPVPPPPAA